MLHVSIRFYAELNDFLPPEKRHATIVKALKERDAVKDVVESEGVPHTEVDLIIVNGEPAGFAYRVHNGDRIGIYPAFRAIDVSRLRHLRPPLEGEPRFVLDAHLGKLAGLLRLLGFDVLYRNDDDDETLARISAEQERILLTRDRGLLKRSIVTYGYHVWETNPGRQLVEVLRRFNLSAQISPFRRCLRCNAVLEPVSKEAVIDRLEPKTRLYYDEFAFCRACDQVYWKGSHYARLQGLIAQLTRGTGQT